MSKNEQWKDLIGYSGMYKVSNYGKVKSYKRYKIGKELKLVLDKDGYQIISLYKNNNGKNAKVHRIVAEYFIPNPLNKPQVNHLDGNKLNNYYKNLEWCTSKQNIQHARKNGLSNSVHLSKKVYCIELDKEFKSAREAGRKLNINQSSISACCNGKLKSAGKYPNNTFIKLTWKYI